MAGGRYSWVSFRNADRKLFRMYVDSVKHFKDRYYVIRLQGRAAYTSMSKMMTVCGEDGIPEKDEEGKVTTKLCSVFPFFGGKVTLTVPLSTTLEKTGIWTIRTRRRISDFVNGWIVLASARG